jgi:hypothetical protein
MLNFGNIRRKDLTYLSLIVILLVWSIFVQAVGAFCYPNGNWDGNPQNVDQYPERLWNWNDTQIGRSFHSGPIIVNAFSIFNYIFKNSISHLSGDDTNKSLGWSKLYREGIIGRLKGYDNASSTNPKTTLLLVKISHYKINPPNF